MEIKINIVTFKSTKKKMLIYKEKIQIYVYIYDICMYDIILNYNNIATDLSLFEVITYKTAVFPV